MRAGASLDARQPNAKDLLMTPRLSALPLAAALAALLAAPALGQDAEEPSGFDLIGQGAGRIVQGFAAEAVPARSVMVTVTVASPAAAGVPAMTPVAGSSVSPAGSAGATMNVAVPVRATVGVTGAMALPATPATGP